MSRENMIFVLAVGVVLVTLSATITARAIDEARRIEALGKWAPK